MSNHLPGFKHKLPMCFLFRRIFNVVFTAVWLMYYCATSFMCHCLDMTRNDCEFQIYRNHENNCEFYNVHVKHLSCLLSLRNLNMIKLLFLLHTVCNFPQMCYDMWTSVYCLNRYYDYVVSLWFITTSVVIMSVLWLIVGKFKFKDII